MLHFFLGSHLSALFNTLDFCLCKEAVRFSQELALQAMQDEQPSMFEKITLIILQKVQTAVAALNPVLVQVLTLQ